MPDNIRNDLITGCIVVAFALAVLLVLVPYGVDRPGQVDVSALSPNFWPTVLGVFLLAMGTLVAGQTLWRHKTRKAPAPENRAPAQDWPGLDPVPKTMAAVALLFVYYAVLEPLGLVAASMLAMVAFTVLAGERRIAIVAPLAILVPVALYLFFQEVAQVAIPVGIFEEMFG